MGGGDEETNLIDLFAREHFEAHRLLAIENPNVPKLVCAWWMMSTILHKDGKRVKITAAEYEESRIAFVRLSSERARRMRDNAGRGYDYKHNFISLSFRYGEELFPTIQKATVTRLIYLATYCNDQNELRVGYKPMDKNMMKKIMKLSKGVFYKFVSEIINANILIEKNDKLFLNKDIFFRGNPHGRHKVNYTRLNIREVRTLYETADSASYHKFLSYAFKLIPYTNKEWNIICYNPEEHDKDKIMPCSKKDILDLLRIQNHGDAVFAKMMAYKFHGRNLFSVLVNKDTTIFINPKVFYGGSRYKEVEIIAFGS